MTRVMTRAAGRTPGRDTACHRNGPKKPSFRDYIHNRRAARYREGRSATADNLRHVQPGRDQLLKKLGDPHERLRGFPRGPRRQQGRDVTVVSV